MDFPITDLMDEDACYAKLVHWLHPDGLACPRCQQADRMRVHRSHRAPVRDYRCGHCRRVFNAFTGTILHGTRRRPGELALIVRGIAQGVSTARLARARVRPLGIARAAAPAAGRGLPKSGPDAAG
jgi:transposase-like protein